MAQLNGSKTPLLESGLAVEEENDPNDGGGGRWWKKVVDVEEAKNQIIFALPLIFTNLVYYSIPLISVMFAGHLGELELASSNLANSWSTVTGLSFMGVIDYICSYFSLTIPLSKRRHSAVSSFVVFIMCNSVFLRILKVGLSGALETLCGQGYGAKLYQMLGIYLQASCVISIIFSLLISVLWLFTESILIFLKQDPSISKLAAEYIKYLIPGLFAYGLMNSILRFLQTQSIVMPLVICSLLPTIFHIGLAYVLVHCTSLGFIGAPLAASISFWISLFMLVIYVLYAEKFKETWQGFSLESFNHVFTNLKLALPSAAMVLLEYCAFELLVLLAGLMPNSEITTSLIAMCVNTEAVAYMITYGLSAAASTRVSNELGADSPVRAKHAMSVTLKLSILLALVVVLALGFGHDIWAGLFSDSPVIIKEYATITPLLFISIVFDSIQGILSGVARGCGWQHFAVYINLAMFYLIGMPIATVLAFKLKLYAKGLWMGLICGLFCQAGSLLLLMYLKKWKRTELH